MTGVFWLDWAALALSLTNTILLIWLGTTVLINVEERSWGGWLAAAGLYFGGIFFISHTAILGYGFQVSSLGTTFWWAIGLLAVTILPFLWYVMMLWYSGFWQKGKAGEINRLVNRHRTWIIVVLVVLIVVLIVGKAMQAQPLSGGYPARGINESFTIRGVPVVLVMFPVYLILCMGLSLDAVRNPGPSKDVIGELAHKRARPWLISASLMLLVVSLAVMGVFYWLFQLVGQDIFALGDVFVIGLFDVVIEVLITGAVILVGQAVVAYEIFTGQSLPRRGFIRQWHYAVMIALGFGIVIGFVFSTGLREIYGILLSSLMMTFFLALFSWRMVSERQRTIRSLRPFVTSERMYDQVVAGDGETSELEGGGLAPFAALCRDVLDTNLAYLLALGSMSPLAGEPMKYLDGKIMLVGQELSEGLKSVVQVAAGSFQVEEQIARFELPSDPGIKWAVPLWSQRGLVGALLIGVKKDEGLYSREEIEVAQSSGERLIDSRVSAEVTRRLLGLQRQRITEAQVMDQRVRRVLHDEVLQDLHAAILNLANLEGSKEAIEMMTDVHGEISQLIRNLPGTSVPDLAGMGLIESLKQLVEDEIGQKFDQVRWEIPTEVAQADEDLSQLEQEVLYYAAREAMRNAARHGRVEGLGHRPLGLRIAISNQQGIRIVIEDDGIGFSANGNRQQTSKQGLQLHSTMMAVIGGEMKIESEVGEFTRVSMTLKK
jgi:signal transduction histidine kinase